MSQQGMTIISAISVRLGIITLSDIIAMSVKRFLGKFLEDAGSVTATGTMVSIIPAAGKTFYFGGAKASSFSQGGTDPTWQAQLQNDGNLREVYDGRIFEVPDTKFKGENVSKMVGDSLDGDGAKEYRIEVILIGGGGAPPIDGNMFGYIENDADNPFEDFQ